MENAPLTGATLHRQRCTPCEGHGAALPPARVAKLLRQLPGWRLTQDRRAIERTIRLDGFDQAVSFVNALAWIAQAQGHHPDFTVQGTYCRVRFSTHALDALTENDFICAARVDRLAPAAEES
ncbi:MAG: 4a-hydroxytetrahydrobiopterin dehydratase [Gammaproteobacteria bacterium]